MTRYSKTILAGLAVAAVFTISPALANPQMTPQRMVEAVGLMPHLELLYKSYVRKGEDGLAAAPQKAAFFKRWQAASEDIWQPAKLHARIAAKLDGKFTAQELDALGRFYGSELGRKVSAVEAAENTLPSQTQFMFKMMFDPGKMMKRASQAPERLGLCQNLNKALGGRNFGGLIAAHSAAAAKMTSMADGQTMTPDRLGDIIKAQIAGHKGAPSASAGPLAKIQIFQQANTYKDLNTAELKDYIAFLATQPAQKFGLETYAAAKAALNEAAMDFHRSLARRAATP